MSLLSPVAPSVAQVYITEELSRRASRKTDYLREKRALQELASRMVDAPEEVLPRFVDLAMQMTGGIAAGLSLYEGDDTRVFRWRYLRGLLSPFEGAVTPRDFSPCGITLDENRPVLSLHPERVYDWISEADIEVPEVLLVPLYLGGKQPLGTLWIVSAEEGHFDAGHARAMTELATFVGAALALLESQKRLSRALEEQERLTAEMGHRIKNLFAIAAGMIRTTARHTSSKEEMAATLSGRLHALASAHDLVSRTVRGSEASLRVTDLGELIDVIMRPHCSGQAARYSLGGPAIPCSDKAVDGLALVTHELATNAAKYGALSTEDGHVEIGWQSRGDLVVLTWTERGGPPVQNRPEVSGHGSRLIHTTVTRQLGGTLDYEWHRDGLAVTIAVPSSSLLI
ncbi:HWE histidine kinase domain-containing protein [Chelativorans sp.]|uniref:sensor histidine kinase n=1 Tax=Chelativorans sp. TaxID=2203393 RepID=UPI0028110722|nr:HWE histidine kinase domain-containing protein [Chelativorans sp.]